MRDEVTPYLFSEFERRHSEAVDWCSARADRAAPGNSLRTQEMNPGACFCSRDPRPWSGETLEYSYLEDMAAVDRVVNRRRALLVDSHGEVASRSGRILLFWPQDTLFTQVMHPASEGLFELNGDLPPWDTWIAYLIAPRPTIRAAWTTPQYRRNEVLVCWIPEVFSGLADRGFDASEVELGAWVPSDRPLKVLHEELMRSLA